MAKWEIAFKFKSCTPTVMVEADTAELAVDIARERDWPPVPQYIQATAAKLGRGGARLGAGAKKGVPRIKHRRTVKKSMLWTPAEWDEVKAQAKRKRLTVAQYQRMKILSGNA